MMTWKIWLVVAGVFLVIEILPPPTHFGALCLAFGALAASIAAFFTPTTWVPWVVFGLTSVALIPVLIPLARFLFTQKPHASNSDALIGQRALVVDSVSAKSPGMVKVRGEDWRAVTESDSDSFKENEWVEVVKIEGTHVVVRRAS